MIVQSDSVPREAAPLLGDPHPLLAQIGWPEGPTPPALAASAWQLHRVRSLPALRSFLESYRAELLLPLELPAIVRAHSLAGRNGLRELIDLDQQMAREPKLRHLASASCRVGQRQLNRLRSLRDHRLLQRYRLAIQRGRAHGWHTLVYGVSLSVFSLPLRQGLAAYASHTLGGFIERAAGPLALPKEQCRELQAQAGAPVPQAVQELLLTHGAAWLRVV